MGLTLGEVIVARWLSMVSELSAAKSAADAAGLGVVIRGIRRSIYWRRWRECAWGRGVNDGKRMRNLHRGPFAALQLDHLHLLRQLQRSWWPCVCYPLRSVRPMRRESHRWALYNKVRLTGSTCAVTRNCCSAAMKNAAEWARRSRDAFGDCSAGAENDTTLPATNLHNDGCAQLTKIKLRRQWI